MMKIIEFLFGKKKPKEIKKEEKKDSSSVFIPLDGWPTYSEHSSNNDLSNSSENSSDIDWHSDSD